MVPLIDDKALYAAFAYGSGQQWYKPGYDHDGYEATLGYNFQNGVGLLAMWNKQEAEGVDAVAGKSNGVSSDTVDYYTLGANYKFNRRLSLAAEFRINNKEASSFAAVKDPVTGLAVDAANDWQLAARYDFCEPKSRAPTGRLARYCGASHPDMGCRGLGRDGQNDVAGLDQCRSRGANTQLQLFGGIVGDDGIDQATTGQLDSHLGVDGTLAQALHLAAQLVAGTELQVALTGQHYDPGGLDQGRGRFTHGQPQRLGTGFGDYGHQLVATGQGQFYFGVDRAVDQGGDGAFEYIPCADFHLLFLLTSGNSGASWPDPRKLVAIASRA